MNDLSVDIRAKEPLEALTEIAAARRGLEAEAEVQVRRARLQGYSWELIAAALGVTRQAVHKRYAGRAGLLRRRNP